MMPGAFRTQSKGGAVLVALGAGDGDAGGVDGGRREYLESIVCGADWRGAFWGLSLCLWLCARAMPPVQAMSMDNTAPTFISFTRRLIGSSGSSMKK